jgi:hypothetical protein
MWPFGKEIQSEVCTLKAIPDGVLCFVQEKSGKRNVNGCLVKFEISLKTYDHVINYFMQMKSKELQAQIIDCESSVLLGTVSLPSADMLRQGRKSLQFASHMAFTAPDGEFLGTVHYACGAYGLEDHMIVNSDFELKSHGRDEIVVSRPIYVYDKDFRELVKTRPEPRFELAEQYRRVHKKKVILTDLQQQFTRMKVISPIPGVETRFCFESYYQADKNVTVRVQIDDERLRLLSPRDSIEEPDYLRTFHIARNERLELNQNANIPVEEKFHLLKGNERFKLRSGQRLICEFAFFTVSDFEGKEISIFFFDDSQEMLDCCTVQIRKSAPVVHENILLYLPDGGVVTSTLRTALKIRSAIASSSAILCTATEFGVRLSSRPIKSSMKCFVYLFDETCELAKIVRLQVMIVADEVMQTDSRLQIDVKRWMVLPTVAALLIR